VAAVLPLQRTTQLTSRNAANQNNQASYTAVNLYMIFVCAAPVLASAAIGPKTESQLILYHCYSQY